MIKIWEQAVKQGEARPFSPVIPKILSLLKSLSDKQSGLEYLETILKYLASGTDKVGAEELKSVVVGSLSRKSREILPLKKESAQKTNRKSQCGYRT